MKKNEKELVPDHFLIPGGGTVMNKQRYLLGVLGGHGAAGGS